MLSDLFAALMGALCGVIVYEYIRSRYFRGL